MLSWQYRVHDGKALTIGEKAARRVRIPEGLRGSPIIEHALNDAEGGERTVSPQQTNLSGNLGH